MQPAGLLDGDGQSELPLDHRRLALQAVVELTVDVGELDGDEHGTQHEHQEEDERR